MEQVKSFCRRYRRLLLAAAYLAIFAVGVLYLRVTVNIPPEGDDKLTLNLWLYDFQRMPFWQYALQDLQGRLRYFTLQEVRFFPFHYPNAVDLLFYTSLTHYRLYIIAWTGAAAFAVSRVAARLGSGDALALGGFALAGLLIFFGVPFKKLRGRTLGALAGFGLAVWALPALLLALSARYQQPEAITWQWGYIPAAASSIGFTLLAAALLALLAGLCCKLPKVLSVVSRLALTAALAVGLCLNGGYLRGVVRTHHAENLAAYQFFVRTIEAGLADAVQSDDLILCNENVWDSNAEAESAFFSRFTGRALHAQVLWTENPATDGDAYAYQTYRNYGGYDLAWCGRLQSADSDLMDGVQVYVQSAYVPDNAVIKYKVRLADGTEEARAICLLDCTQTPRDRNGDYLATVEDTSIVNAKLMIWDG